MSAVLIILLIVLFALNGFFVASEFALVRVRRGRVEATDDAVSRRVLDQIENINAYLAAAQLGITMTSIGIGYLGEPALGHLIESAIGEDIVSPAVSAAIAVALSFTIVTTLHISLGEQVPKLYAIARAERTARRVARPLGAFRAMAGPLVWALNGFSNRVVRALGVGPEELDAQHSAEDLRTIIAESAGGSLDPGEALMLSGVFHLHEQEARQVMTPIPAVVTVDVSETIETALRRCVSSGHTRLVVTEDENSDRVRGIVHANSLVRAYIDASTSELAELVKAAPIIPETKPLDDLLTELQTQRLGLAVVVDEYGRTVGVVSVEDILEEVVGEIEDETDPRASAVRRLASGDWYVRGHVPLADLDDSGIGLPVDTEAYNSIGGWVFGELGRLPKRGDVITVDGYEVRVESVRENRVEAVRIRPVEQPDNPLRSGGSAERRQP
ncbi:MAG: hemolysin family protein [Solirubrobacterales bacterium]